jgi:hypothetical protein
MAEAAPYGVPVPYPRKSQPLSYPTDKPQSFVNNLFVTKGTVLRTLIPHLALGLVVTVLARVLQYIG